MITRTPEELKTLVKTADGKPWVQPCFVCGKVVDFIKFMPHQRVHVGPYVRHWKCRPEALK